MNWSVLESLVGRDFFTTWILCLEALLFEALGLSGSGFRAHFLQGLGFRGPAFRA